MPKDGLWRLSLRKPKDSWDLGNARQTTLLRKLLPPSLTALQYNILSLVKRFTAYETMGKLFETVSKDSLELSVTDRIWGALQEIVIAIAELFGLTDEDIYEAIINKSEDMNHLCEIYKLKLAS
jgi:hypothetical protein